MIFLGLWGKELIEDGEKCYCWISERCIEGITECKKKCVDYSVLDRVYNSEEDINDAVKFLKQIKKEMMVFTSNMLNRYSGCSYREDQWKYLIGQWMNYYLEVIYECYKKIEAIETGSVKYVCNVYENIEIQPPLDFAEFVELVSCSGDYRSYIFSCVIDQIPSLKNITFRKVKQYKKPECNTKKPFKMKYKTALYRKGLYIVKAFTRKQDKVVFNGCSFPKQILSEIIFKASGTITDYINNWFTLERPHLQYKVDFKYRKRISTREDVNKTDICVLVFDVAKKLLPQFLPLTFLEGFEYLRTKAIKDYKYAQKPNAVFFSCVEGHFDEVFKVYLMQLREKGNTVYCGVQHGGNYGVDKIWSSDDEYANCDRFYTWGWTTSDSEFSDRFIRMPAAKLMNKELRRVGGGNKILYINYLYTVYPIDLSVRTLFNDLSVEEEIRFFEELNPKIISDMIVRLYPDDYGWGFKEKLKDRCPDLNYDAIDKFYDSLSQAKMVVLSDWSTTVVEALSVNKPILVLRNTNTENFAKKDIEDLIRVGVVVTSWKELKTSLEKIYQDIDSWWNDLERQRVITRIKDKYLFLPNNAEELWEEEILRYTIGGV